MAHNFFYNNFVFDDTEKATLLNNNFGSRTVLDIGSATLLDDRVKDNDLINDQPIFNAEEYVMCYRT